ncbi:MAG: 3-dehydroquinate synthase [Bacteroidia bacterium]
MEIKSTGYSVYLSEDISVEINRFLDSQTEYSKLFILVDENSFRHCYPQLVEKVQRFEQAELIEIESGEENKNITICTHIWSALSECGADRKSLFINIGGGVIGDMGGFVASTFKRGIDFINIPTTLLSQVDASIGGKLGIDMNHLKNEIGLFNNPKAVFINSNFLTTLDKRQLLSGFAEIIKHGLIVDFNYWKAILKIDLFNDSLVETIKTSITIKNNIVAADPHEKNVRKKLNFGHTIGHALETFFLEQNIEKAFLHGEAIAIGMICEAYLSQKSTNLSKEALTEITQFIIKTYGLIDITNVDTDKIIELMKHDKKNENNCINFSLLSAIGSCEINKSVEIDLIIESLTYYSMQDKIE